MDTIASDLLKRLKDISLLGVPFVCDVVFHTSGWGEGGGVYRQVNLLRWKVMRESVV